MGIPNVIYYSVPFLQVYSLVTLHIYTFYFNEKGRGQWDSLCRLKLYDDEINLSDPDQPK